MKKNKPLVTVSITCKNYGKFLKKSLESVLNQTYKKIEIFVVDDNSEDKSKKILSASAVTSLVFLCRKTPIILSGKISLAIRKCFNPILPKPTINIFLRSTKFS